MARNVSYELLPSDAPQKKAERPYFQFWARDWLSSAAVASMTPEQEGGFVHLLCLSWFEDPPCSLVVDDAVLSRLSRLGARRWRKVGALIRAQFESIEVAGSGPRLRNSKLYSVYCDMVAGHGRRVEAGRRGGEATAARGQRDSNAGSNAGSNDAANTQHADADSDADADADADAGDTQTAIASHGAQSTRSNKSAKTRRRVRKGEPDARVEQVLEHYVAMHPERRLGDKDAAVVRRALDVYSPEELMAAIDGNPADEWHCERGKHELAYVLRERKIDDFRLRPAPVVHDPSGFFVNGRPTAAYDAWVAAGEPV